MSDNNNNQFIDVDGMDLYTIVEFPDVQHLMEVKGFRTNACLINTVEFIKHNLSNPSSAYFVSIAWMKDNNI